MNKPAIKIAAAFFILLLSAGCGGDRQVWKGTVSEEDEEGFQQVVRYRLVWNLD